MEEEQVSARVIVHVYFIVALIQAVKESKNWLWVAQARHRGKLFLKFMTIVITLTPQVYDDYMSDNIILDMTFELPLKFPSAISVIDPFHFKPALSDTQSDDGTINSAIESEMQYTVAAIPKFTFSDETLVCVEQAADTSINPSSYITAFAYDDGECITHYEKNSSMKSSAPISAIDPFHFKPAELALSDTQTDDGTIDLESEMQYTVAAIPKFTFSDETLVCVEQAADTSINPSSYITAFAYDDGECITHYEKNSSMKSSAPISAIDPFHFKPAELALSDTQTDDGTIDLESEMQYTVAAIPKFTFSDETLVCVEQAADTSINHITTFAYDDGECITHSKGNVSTRSMKSAETDSLEFSTDKRIMPSLRNNKRGYIEALVYTSNETINNVEQQNDTSVSPSNKDGYVDMSKLI